MAKLAEKSTTVTFTATKENYDRMTGYCPKREGVTRGAPTGAIKALMLGHIVDDAGERASKAIGETVKVNMYIPTQLLEMARENAIRQGVSTSAYLAEVLERSLDQMDEISGK